MDQSRFELISKKYGEFVEKISQLKKKKLEVIAKYRKKVDEEKLRKLRDETRKENI